MLHINHSKYTSRIPVKVPSTPVTDLLYDGGPEPLPLPWVKCELIPAAGMESSNRGDERASFRLKITKIHQPAPLIKSH